MRVTHLGPVAVVLALSVSVATCRLDKLINPATADRLVVDRDSVTGSAHVGSLLTDTTIVRVASADGVRLPWTATKAATWVTLSPSPDSLLVILHAEDTTLSVALHQDTIVLTSPDSKDTVRLPVAFDVLARQADLGLSAGAHTGTAFVRSAQPDTFSVRIKNTGGLPLTWTATLDTGWVTLSDSGGTVPAQDTTSTVLLVTLRPESLSIGTHSGRIVFTAPPGTIGAPDTVPITYTIQPCAETGITLDTVKSSAITLSDCGAPQKAGRQAKLYTVQAALGDTLSFRVTATFNAYLILTNSTGAVVLDSLDQCGAALTACLLNYHVTTSGRHVLEVTTTNAGETGSFTLTGVKELSPSQPAPGQFRANGTTAIGVGTITPESTVVFKATVNDANPFDSVRLEVDLTELASGTTSYMSAFVAPGASVSLPVTGLHDNQGYHWRARTCDKTGRCSTYFNFGGNVDPAADFIVNSQPQNPTMGSLDQLGPGGQMAIGGGTGGNYPNSVVVTFEAAVTDLDPGDVIKIEAEYKQTGTNFDSTTTGGSAVLSGDTAAVSVSIAVALLNLRVDYHWRARVCDQTGRCSAWVSFGGNADPNGIDFHVP